MLAIVRPDSWNLPLFVHVAGAMLLVGVLVVATVAAGVALRRGDGWPALTRLGFRSLLLGGFPSYLLMRVGAEWVASEEDTSDPSWIGIGYAVADVGLLLLIVATVLAWRAARRPDGAPGLERAVAVLSGLVLIGYLVAVWAMTAKPL